MATPLPTESAQPVPFNEAVPRNIRAELERNSNLFRYSLLKNRTSTTQTTEEQLQKAGGNIYTHVANAYFETSEKDPNQFEKWISGMNEGAKYSGSWSKENIDTEIKRITKENGLKSEQRCPFIVGLAAQRMLGSTGNALENFLTDAIIDNDPLVIPALTALRDEMVILESGPLIRQKSSPSIERNVALHGILMPGAWQHLHESSTRFMIEQGSDFPMKTALPKLDPIDRNILVQSGIAALTDANILPNDHPEPSTPQEIRENTRNLGCVERGFTSGLRHDLLNRKRGEIATLPFEDIFNNRTEGADRPLLLIQDEEDKILNSEQGQKSFLAGSLMRALVREDEGNYFSAAEITSRFATPSENKQFITALLEGFSHTLSMIFEKDNTNRTYVQIRDKVAACKKVLIPKRK